MSVWVPEDQRDTSWPIWNKLFKCRIPYLLSKTPEEIKFYGVHYCGEPTRDEQTKNELVVRYLTINQMVEYWKKSISVYVINRDDTVEIYEIIKKHLDAWVGYVRTSEMPQNAPIQDLVDLDKFAFTVHQHAKYILTDEFEELAIAKGLTSGFKYTPKSLFKKKPVVTTTPDGEVDEEAKYHKHVSMTDVFLNASTPEINFNYSPFADRKK